VSDAALNRILAVDAKLSVLGQVSLRSRHLTQPGRLVSAGDKVLVYDKGTGNVVCFNRHRVVAFVLAHPQARISVFTADKQNVYLIYGDGDDQFFSTCSLNSGLCFYSQSIHIQLRTPQFIQTRTLSNSLPRALASPWAPNPSILYYVDALGGLFGFSLIDLLFFELAQSGESTVPSGSDYTMSSSYPFQSGVRQVAVTEEDEIVLLFDDRVVELMSNRTWTLPSGTTFNWYDSFFFAVPNPPAT
jgi:hypothetical protein